MQAKSLAQHPDTTGANLSRIVTGNEEGLNGYEMKKQRTQLKRNLSKPHSHMV